jgi:NAD(P)-dependent dehydrogenase (short-subunit alcohol dehydrogenase family)
MSQSPPQNTHPQISSQISKEDWETCIRVLHLLAKDPFAGHDTQVFKTLITKIHKAAKKEIRRENRAELVQHDANLRSQTQVFQINDPRAPNQKVHHALPLDLNQAKHYHRLERCYCCKAMYSQVHFFYHLLCPQCAAFNYHKRGQSSDLTGRIALITGGRIKIGYQLALKLLRDGAQVIVTTRFAHDAAQRFALEPDFADWQDRLSIAAQDFRNIPALERFIADLLHTLPHLDILINNAAQTIRRPPAFYAHLHALERIPKTDLPPHLQNIVLQKIVLSDASPQFLETSTPDLERYFPLGQFDKDGQQLDQRPHNSWSATADQVSTLEMLEVQLISNVAPFLLVGQLKPLLLKSPHSRRFVVNVSAMEGQFARASKTEFHPHTNMAKAALNMLTRTSAQDYARDQIYMTSVDTGWITEENPHPKREHLREGGFVTPLDVIDGMARVYDPIVSGLSSAEVPFLEYFSKIICPMIGKLLGKLLGKLAQLEEPT